MTKRKDERRELLKEDDFLSFLERSAQYISQNRQRVLIISLAVFAGLIAIFGMRTYLESQRYDQAGLIYQVEEILQVDPNETRPEFQFDTDKERYEAAHAKLEEILPQLDGSSRVQGLLYKVECMTMLGKTEGIDGVLKEIADSGNLLAFVGVVGLGDFYLAEEQYDDAIAQYNRLLRLPPAPEMDVLANYKIAQVHQDRGDLDKAKKALQDLKAKYDDADPGSKPPLMTDVDTLLEELNAATGDAVPAATEG